MEGIYVYLIRSMTFPERRYVGLSRDPEMRLSEHNSGVVGATWRYRKWELVTAVWFKEMKKAEVFEEYLKHGSGHAFAKRHFW
jgi:putative endonuclease